MTRHRSLGAGADGSHRRTRAGNPFFAEEIVRDLSERGALRGAQGSYLLAVRSPISVCPPHLQAAIAARVDRLSSAAKCTLKPRR